MNNLERRAFEHFLPLYKRQWDQNQYNRTNYDEDLEYYLGYRNEYKYPFAYNESFNKILPVIMTILSRFMDQLYQTGNLISVRARTRDDVERKTIVEGLLNYQMETMNDIDMQGGSYLTMLKWLFNGITFGKGIVKAYWKKEERIMPRRIALPVPKFDALGRIIGMETIDHISMEPQVLYDQPYLEVLHNKLFVPDTTYKNIQQMPAVFCVYRRSFDYVKKMAARGIFKNIKEIPWNAAGSGNSGYARDTEEAFAQSLEIEGALETQQLAECESKHISPMLDIIEGYGRFIFEDTPIATSGPQLKGKEEEAIVHIANYKTVIKIEKNPYHYRPFFDIGAYLQPEMFWDVGITRLCKGIQEQYNNLANLRMQNASMLVNQMLKVREDSDIDPAALIWKPFGLIPVEEMNDVEPLIIPDVGQTQVFREQEQFFDETIQDMSGIYAYNKGVTPQRQERVGTVYCLDSDTYEILTDDGWKKYAELNGDEEVMTLNYQTGEMEWQKPEEYIEFPEKEYELYHFKNASAEFYCTKDHRLPIEREARNNTFNKQIVRAGDLSECSHAKIPLTGIWASGEEQDICPFDNILPEDWAAFMGIYLAEGHIQHNVKNWCYRVGISQEVPENVIQIQQLIDRLPFNFKYNGKQWLVNNKKLYFYLKQFGKSHEKYVPVQLKNQSKRLLEIFFSWFHLGDGHINHCGQRCITTASKRLADDLQEILLKLGKRAHIWKENKREPHHYDKYHVHESTDKYTWWYHNGKKSVTKIKRKCKVSCLRVKNGIFMIRSINCKKPIWTGNSLQSMGEARTKLLLMTMDHMGIRPLLKYMMILNTYHLPHGAEFRFTDRQGDNFGQVFAGDIHPDFDFSARYTSMEPALGKQFRAQQLIQYAQMWQQRPELNHYQFMKAVLELMDFKDQDRYLKDPEQMMREQQQAIQLQMMMAQQETKKEMNLEQMKIQGDIQKEVVKGLMK